MTLLAELVRRLERHVRREEDGIFRALRDSGEFLDEVDALKGEHNEFEKSIAALDPEARDFPAAVSTLLDESYKIAITRLGNRIRVGGMAELSGFDGRLPAQREATLRHSLRDLFPGGADMAAPSHFWSGFRPMTPDSTPIIGATRVANLFLNTGHGTLGWTMACGSGRLVTSLIGGQSPPIGPAGLGIQRYM